MKRFINIIIVIITIFALFLTLNKCFSLKSSDNKKIKTITKKESILQTNTHTVCIDAGHGFDDPGCQSEFLNKNESAITLTIANILKEKLETKEIKIILTHNGKSFPSCEKIIKTAQKNKIYFDQNRLIENNVFSAYERAIYCSIINKKTPIDLFISLHINSIEDDSKVSQYEMYYYEKNPYVEKIKLLCENLEAKFDNKTKISALNEYNAYTVTRYAEFPAVLLEMGYATNINDAKKLNSKKWQDEFSNILSSEIINWLKE